MAQTVRYSLNQLMLDLGLTLRDAHPFKVSNQAQPNQTIINKLAFGRSDRYVDSEVWVWDLPVDATGDNPFLVRTSGPDGTLTFTENVGPTAIPAGARVVLQNINGKGHPHVLKEQAIKFALLQSGNMVHARADITDPDLTTYWQDIPAGLDSIYKVVITDSVFPLWQTELSPSTWGEIDQINNRIYLPYDLNGGSYTVQIYGRANLSWPWTTTPNYNATVNVRPERVIKDAITWLLMFRRDDREQAIAANLFNEKVRTRRNVPYPDEVFLENPVAA